MKKCLLLIFMLIFFQNEYSFCSDSLFLRHDKAIMDESVGIPRVGRFSDYEMIQRIQLISDIFVFDGFLSICFERMDYSQIYDTIIAVNVMWIVENYDGLNTEKSSYFYDRFLIWWVRAAHYTVYNDNVIYSQTREFMRRVSGKFFNYDEMSISFFEDDRYFINTNLFETNHDFYIENESTKLCQLYKSKFIAFVLDYKLKDKNLKVLMPVSEALEFRPATEPEVQAMGYTKADVVVILK